MRAAQTETPSTALVVAKALSGGTCASVARRRCASTTATRGPTGPPPLHHLGHLLLRPPVLHGPRAQRPREARVDPLLADIGCVFRARAKKTEGVTSARLGVREHLVAEAFGRSWLCLWLDCDREGKGIGFELLRALPHFTPDRVWRARFSLKPNEVHKALRHLGKPDPAEAAAVDARQEIDLKLGITFTRLLTRALRESARTKFDLPRLRLLPYGPCPMAALKLVCQRQDEVEASLAKPYYEVICKVSSRMQAAACKQQQHTARSSSTLTPSLLSSLPAGADQTSQVPKAGARGGEADAEERQG